MEAQNDVMVRRRRQGQTLVEFALTLPILLLLLFGIIEFGRIFQAWVTLQNSARAAARYASTGQYDTLRYTLNTNGADDQASHVPCWRGNGSERGNLATLSINDSANPENRVNIYERGGEMLYATWYGGDDCNPEIDDDQNRRKDLVRILSIMNEARLGAVGLAAAPLPYIGVTNPDGSQPYRPPNGAAAYASVSTANWAAVPWFHIWDRPLAASNGTPNARLNGSDRRAWFDVMICSSRLKLDAANESYFNVTAAGATSEGANDFRQAQELRFRTVLDSAISPYAPACLLNESPNSTLDSAGWTENRRRPWLDAGGPGDVVTIVITFNHPLITPLGFGDYVQLQARRSAVNEAFRATRAANLGQFVQSSPPGGTNPPTQPSPTPSATPPTPPTATFTSTPFGTQPPTSTPRPDFTCTGFAASFVRFEGRDALFNLSNPNFQATTLRRATIQWRALTTFPGFGVSAVRLNGATIWSSPGGDTTPPTDIAEPGITTADGNYLGGLAAPIPGNQPPNTGVSSLRVSFSTNSPPDFSTAYQSGWFNNSTFIFTNILGGTDCTVTLNITAPPDTATPSSPATNTPVPACLPGLIRAQFDSFGFGATALWRVTNGRNVPAVMVGFRMPWNNRTGNMTLDAVWVGPPSAAGSILLWRAASSTEDRTPPTNGRAPNAPADVPAGEGSWPGTLTIPAGEDRVLYFDFGGPGMSGTLPGSVSGLTQRDYDGAELYFASPLCPAEGNQTGLIDSEPVRPIIPTPPPFTPTFTPGPTNTPWPTWTPGPPPPPPPPPPTNPPPPTSPPPTSPPPPPPPPPTSPPPPFGGGGGGGGNDKVRRYR